MSRYTVTLRDKYTGEEVMTEALVTEIKIDTRYPLFSPESTLQVTAKVVVDPEKIIGGHREEYDFFL